MRLSVVLCLLTIFCASANVSYSQVAEISLDLNNVTLKQALDEVKQQSEYSFWYRDKEINLNKKVSVRLDRQNINVVLENLLAGQGLAYMIDEKHIIIYKKTEEAVVGKNLQQIKRITGKVVDYKGETIIGANILVKHSENNGTVTDINGHFSLDVPANATIQVSYIGYVEQEIKIGNQTELKIVLQEDSRALDEVVVVGYGTQKKINLTGAVTAISSEVINKRQVGQASLALQGTAPGVTITQRSGQPGLDEGDIKIRGIGTLNNANPLILVDGIEMGLNSLDVSTIESISVLKDAASASIYGSKAANGVILVTTKRAAEGKFNISYSGYVTKQSPTNMPKKLGAIDHMMLLNESKLNAGAGAVYTEEQIRDWREKGPSDRDHYPDTDWQDAILQGNGIQHNHSLTMTGGTDKLKVLASIGYLGQGGIINNVDFERISLRLNTDFIFSKYFSSSLDVYLYNSNRNSVAKYNSESSNGSGIGYIFYLMNKLPAVQACQYANGNYAEGQNGENPVASIHEGGFTNEKSTPMMGNLSFKWTPIDDFWMQAAFSPSISYPQSKAFINRVTTYNPDGSVFSTLPSKSNLTMQSDYNRYLQFRSTANYKKTIKQHTITALAGFQYESNYSSGFNAFRDDYLFPEYTVLQAGSVENMRNDGWAGESVLMSWFGRINYDFNSKYLFEANIRYDGSSKFGKGNKWGAFPSFSAGWRLSEEVFWNNLKEYVSNFKVRASWGTLGNQSINDNYPFSSNIDMTTKYISEDRLMDGAAVLTMNNPDITWETTQMTNVGVDFNLIDKISVSFDWYYKKTKDILLKLDIPRTMGLLATYQNAGTVENKGYDLNITYSDKIGDFDFDLSFNLSDVKNKILDLKGINGTGLVTNREGYSINSLYMYKSLGILSDNDFEADGSYKWTRQIRSLAPGDLRYENSNDDDLINDDDRQVLGSTIPRYTYGINFAGRYKGFDLNILLQGVGKVDGYLTQMAMYPFHMGGTAFDIHKDRWSTENQNTGAAFPRLYFNDSNNYLNSDFYKKSAAYLRLKNVQLGYRIPEAISKKALIEYLRFYVSGENLLTFTNFWNGWDPEVSPAQGGQYYPQVKSIGFGVDIRF